MVIGIGTDIIEIKRIKEAVTKNPRFIEKCFTVNEQEFLIIKRIVFKALQELLLQKKRYLKH